MKKLLRRLWLLIMRPYYLHVYRKIMYDRYRPQLSLLRASGYFFFYTGRRLGEALPWTQPYIEDQLKREREREMEQAQRNNQK